MAVPVIDAARAGDEAAWSHLHAALAPAVRGYFRARRMRDADDLVGEVFLEVARKIGSFSGDAGDFRAWVFVIAHSRYVDAVRAAERRPADLVDAVPETVESIQVEDEVMATLEREELLELVNSLTPDQQSVVMLRIFGDLSVAETAKVLGKTPVAVKVHLYRAVRALRQILGVEPAAQSTPTVRGSGIGVATPQEAAGGVTE
jgi:RNA polymerase sigma-70 factor (ECF subfamily)